MKRARLGIEPSAMACRSIASETPSKASTSTRVVPRTGRIGLRRPISPPRENRVLAGPRALHPGSTISARSKRAERKRVGIGG
jgi:hypothetical protein